MFVFCSDGISEAFDEAGQEFGAPRVIDVIERTLPCSPPKEIVGEIFGAVQKFCGDAEQSDDRTVVVVKINQLGPHRAQRSSSVAGSQISDLATGCSDPATC